MSAVRRCGDTLEEIYTLPTIRPFVAGEKQTIAMTLRTAKPNSKPFDATGCTINFSVINFGNKNGVSIISKLCDIRQDTDGIPCIAVVDLLPLETVTLYGKYIYQITAIDLDGNTEIPMQGLMFITKNINQGFIQSNIS